MLNFYGMKPKVWYGYRWFGMVIDGLAWLEMVGMAGDGSVWDQYRCGTDLRFLPCCETNSHR
jgi:hypothetical protein